MNPQDKIAEALQSAGLGRFGWTPLARPVHMDFYRTWIKDEQFAEMTYLKEHMELKANPQKLMPRAKSAIVVAEPYRPHPQPHSHLKHTRLAEYARGHDYHHWFKGRLKKTAEQLKAFFPQEEFLVFADSGPVMERDLASRAGLGWVGKNTCVIHPKHGSLFFIGEILTSLESTSAPNATPDHCGTCTRCIDVCPTGALTPYKMQASLCISYLNIEARSVPPENLREKIGDWFFGCDLCQNVCPWNVKWQEGRLATEHKLSLDQDSRAGLIKDLSFILTSSHSRLEKEFASTPFNRAGGKRLKRNAIIVAANQRLPELLPMIQSLKTDPYLAEICHWAENLLNT